MPRWFLSGSTPFASFFRCLVTPKPEQETPATGQAFPMPLPYPGVYRRSARRRTSQLCSALRHATNLVVAVLSWLALGCPAAGPSWLSLGKPLTGEQRGAVRRLEALVRVLVHQPEVGPAEMGRVAAKVEAVETQLSRLETIARRLGNFSKHYAGAPHDMHYDFEPRAAEPDPSLRSSSSGRPLSGTAACGWGKGSEACELPSDEIKAHPLWSKVARCCQFGQAWRRPSRRGRHINISEVRAGLQAELRHARRRPNCRVNLAMDSQVAFGALGKGRSSSGAINAELRKSLPVHLGYESYLDLMYFASAENPADDGTRNVPLRSPSDSLPVWWAAALQGDFAGLDAWLQERGALPEDALDLPPISELGVLRTPVPSRQEARLEWLRHPAARSARRPPACASSASAGSPLPAEVQEKLQAFAREQFVVPKGAVLDLSRKGFLDLYSGSFGVARATASRSGCWVLTFEICRSAAEDLCDLELRRRILDLIGSGAFYCCGAGPTCSSMSRAVRPPVRSAAYPAGFPDCREAMRAKVQDGNAHAEFTAAVVRRARASGTDFWVESSLTEPLFSGSASTFRRRWDFILKQLGVPEALKLTPGGLRGGGAVYLYQQQTPVQDLLWRMRLRSANTLESYLQEVAAVSVLPSLTASTRARIEAAAAVCDVQLNHFPGSGHGVQLNHFPA
eukprot:s3508_g4.t1